MKKKALATKMAAFVMAGAMTMAMGFPAFAKDRTSSTIPVWKTVNAGTEQANIYAPKTTFNFVLGVPDTTTNLRYDGNTYYVKKADIKHIQLLAFHLLQYTDKFQRLPLHKLIKNQL